MAPGLAAYPSERPRGYAAYASHDSLVISFEENGNQTEGLNENGKLSL